MIYYISSGKLNLKIFTNFGLIHVTKFIYFALKLEVNDAAQQKLHPRTFLYMS